MTFVDNNETTYTIPVSVPPVNQEGSFGGSENPFDFEFDGDMFLRILALLFGVLVLVMFFPLISSVLTLLINIIVIPFKWIGNLFNKRGKK